MHNIFNRIIRIREKIEEKNFDDIRSFLNKNNLPINKENFDQANRHLGMVSNNSYCKYVLFIGQSLNAKLGR